MNDIIQELNIEKMIYEIRGKQVMLDSDLAKLYQCSNGTKDINKEYNNLTLIYNDTFHDRFIILDKKKMYHLGTSLNNTGTKTFSINKVEDTRWLNLVLKEINIK